MATFIPADETLPVREVQPDNGTDFKLRQLYELLSCETIETVPLPDPAYLMIIDEEGKLTDKPRNERATQMVAFPSPREFVTALLRYRDAGVEVIHAGDPVNDLSTEVDYIAGDALICKDEELR